jgi:hypothetical protein
LVVRGEAAHSLDQQLRQRHGRVAGGWQKGIGNGAEATGTLGT